MALPSIALFASAAVGAAVSAAVRDLFERLLIGLLVVLVLAGVGGLLGGTGYLVVKVGLHDQPELTCGLALLLALAVAIDFGRRMTRDGARGAAAQDDDDSDGGGGQRPPRRQPQAPPPGDGLAPDWDSFDQERRQWERAPERAPERVPVLV